MTFKVVRFCLLGLMLLAGLRPVWAQTTFTVQGTIVQGTPDGTPLPETLPVQLRVFSADGTVRNTFTTTTDNALQFSFTDVPALEDGSYYVLSSPWAGLEQTSLPRLYPEMTTPLEFPLYDVTDSLADVVAQRGNLRIEFTDVNQVGLQMLLELNYSNIGDRIVMSNLNTTEAGAFTIELPVGAFGIAPEEAPGAVQRYRPVSQIGSLPIPGVRDTQPLIPGWPNIMRLSFLVPYEDGAVIDMRFPFSVGDLSVFVREDTVGVESDLLALSERTETSSGRVYQVYNQTQPLEGGEPFKFTLVGTPTTTVRQVATSSSNGDSTTGILIAIVAGAFFLFLGLIGWLLWARRKESIPHA